MSRGGIVGQRGWEELSSWDREGRELGRGMGVSRGGIAGRLEDGREFGRASKRNWLGVEFDEAG